MRRPVGLGAINTGNRGCNQYNISPSLTEPISTEEGAENGRADPNAEAGRGLGEYTPYAS